MDYFTRLLQPWSNLARGPAPATRTLLLDHVSRWQPLTLYYAMVNFDWPVVLTIVISWSLLAAVSGILTLPHLEQHLLTSVEGLLNWLANSGIHACVSRKCHTDKDCSL